MSTSIGLSDTDSGAVIGVVGGGQLAQMLVQAAALRGVKVIVQSNSVDDPASSIANGHILAKPQQADATKELLKRSKGVTFENEWIDVQALQPLEDSGAVFCPPLRAVTPLLDKLSQRRLLHKFGFPGPKWTPLEDITDHPIQLPRGWSFPVMAKAIRGGYDGKGTRVVKGSQELENLLRSVNQNQWFLESWVSYERELALVASRDKYGIIRTLPLAETHQHNQVCDWVIAPADVEHSVELMAYNIASSLLTELNYVGVLCIEFFYGPQGLLVNEIAPRTHNSAHFSIEACNSSQFDQQLCISAGLPVPSPELLVPGALMVNLLGLPLDSGESLEKRLSDLRSNKDFYIHWYGKSSEKPARKLGHVTVLLNSIDSTGRRKEAERVIEQIRSIWPVT